MFGQPDYSTNAPLGIPKQGSDVSECGFIGIHNLKMIFIFMLFAISFYCTLLIVFLEFMFDHFHVVLK